MIRRLLVSALVMLGACAPTDEQRAEQTCTVFCGCVVAPLPALQEACMADCRQESEFSRLSDECIACISENADRCATLEQTCEPICDPPQTDPFFDAGVPF